jgi:hypothetical protein
MTGNEAAADSAMLPLGTCLPPAKYADPGRKEIMTLASANSLETSGGPVRDFAVGRGMVMLIASPTTPRINRTGIT